MATLVLLRAFLPGLLVVQPVTGPLPLSVAITLTAGVLCVVPLLGVGVIHRQPRAVWTAAVLVAAVCLLALVPAPSGPLLTALAGTGSAAGLLGLVTLAGVATAPRGVRLGVLGGLVVEALVRTATTGLGLVWSGTLAGGLLTVVVVGLLIGTARSLVLEPDTGAPEPPPSAPMSAWGWLVPAFVLTGTLTGVTGRIVVATGWNTTQAASATATALVLAVLSALLAPRLPATRVGPAVAALLLVGTTASLPAAGWPTVLGTGGVAVGIGALAGVELPRGLRVSPLRRALIPAVALSGAMALLLVYELTPVIGLPPNVRPLLLLAVALGAAVLAVAAGRPGRSTTVRGRLRPQATLVAVLVAAVTVAVVSLLAPTPQRAAPTTDPEPGRLEVASFSISAGFGVDGRYDPARQAELLRSHDVDLVLLTGVDRGSWLAGGQDVLPLLQAELGLEHLVFAPAGSEVTGHALLSRYPITEFVAQPLPTGPRSRIHSHLVAVVTLPDGLELGVIGTELAAAEEQDPARLAQARAVAGSVARLRERQLPTVLLGELGGPLEGPVLDSFAPLLPGSMPDGARNFPATRPTELRDHVLLSEELRRSALAIPAAPAATHLPVVVRVELVSAEQ